MERGGEEGTMRKWEKGKEEGKRGRGGGGRKEGRCDKLGGGTHERLFCTLNVFSTRFEVLVKQRTL